MLLLVLRAMLRCSLQWSCGARDDDVKAQVSSAKGTSRGGGGGGGYEDMLMLPPEIVKYRVSETPFHELWGKILQNSDGKKTTYIRITNF